jgi:CheY-like chemotaxis protein
VQSEPDPSGNRRIPPPYLRVAIGGAGPGSGHRILIVLSDRAEERLFVNAFERLHWEVAYADDLAALVEVLRSAAPDIALTDDLRVLRTIKHEDRDGGTALVALADERPAAIESAKRAGAEHVIVRPVDPNDPLGFSIS